jgi:glutamate---cysteine ligase / carboxylate-amine ligase
MQPRKVGIEEEFLLVDAHGVPRPRGERVAAGEADIEHELQQEQAEIGTSPFEESAALLADLRDRRAALAEAAIGNGVRAAALATSPLPVQPTPTAEPRYLQMMFDYGATAREQLTCGCHVHVDIASRDEGAMLLAAIQPWLSVLLAISANSPFWQGIDTGYASYRRMVWDRWPGAGPSGGFGSATEYDEVVDALLSSGVLLDNGMVYFDARLSARYPTLEIRVADVCPEPEDAVLVAVLARGLVDAAAGASWPAARPELLRGAAWRAARSGLSEDLVDPVTATAVPAATRLSDLVELISPALRRHGDLAFVESSVARVLARGTGADLQRAAFSRRADLRDVVSDAVHRTVSS